MAHAVNHIKHNNNNEVEHENDNPEDEKNESSALDPTCGHITNKTERIRCKVVSCFNDRNKCFN